MICPISPDGAPSFDVEPAPKKSAATETLAALVGRGDIAGVRAHFDRLFWERRGERPGWEHLRVALLREDRPMLRLLHVWGAAPDEAELARFRSAVGEKYPDYLRLLRAAGLQPAGAPWETLRAENPPQPERDAIARRAYEIYCENGYAPGNDVQNWLRAETELATARARALAQTTQAAQAETDLCRKVIARRDAERRAPAFGK